MTAFYLRNKLNVHCLAEEKKYSPVLLPGLHAITNVVNNYAGRSVYNSVNYAVFEHRETSEVFFQVLVRPRKAYNRTDYNYVYQFINRGLQVISHLQTEYDVMLEAKMLIIFKIMM